MHDTRRLHRIVPAALLALGMLGAAPALAGAKDFVIYAPGYGASASQAKPYLDKFSALLEKQMGWKAGEASPAFLDDAKAVADYIEAKKPGSSGGKPTERTSPGASR